MILPAVRERLDAVLRQPAVEDALAALRSGANQVAFSGLHDVAKALVAAYLTHTLRRPSFFITGNNRRAEALAETLRFFSGIFPGKTAGPSGLAGEVAILPAFDTLPWESQSAHPDILERRAATLFRLADGQILSWSRPSRLLYGATTIPTFTFRSPARSPKTRKSRTRN
jgi:transcription-repair coupling factor (superfamily II helicase)